MPIDASKNLYRGVNPHLNSFMQTEQNRIESSFYDRSIQFMFLGHVSYYLNTHLPENYMAVFQRSLQSMNVEDHVQALTIRKITPQGPSAELIRIELPLIQSKPTGLRYTTYKRRRLSYLKRGILIVEVDFLHETKPLLDELPVYPHDMESTSFYIAVCEPAPQNKGTGKGHSLKQRYARRTFIYGFGIQELIPTIQLQLLENDAISIDFDVIYNNFYVHDRMHFFVDYAQFPERFETYSADDQARIKTRMAEIAQEHGDRQS